MTGLDLRGRFTLTIPEAGQLLGIGRDAAYAAVERGEIQSLTLGGRRKVVPTHALLQQLGWPSEHIARAIGIDTEGTEPGSSTDPGTATVHALTKSTGDPHGGPLAG